mmetsp:Transcript_136180/g.264899  ORF Transcript_136180/g.264899 Transcript_136180/m.264899 type:complete len:88 (+) Transcript_136180:224-487(+)
MLVNFIRCFEIRQDVKEVLKHNCTEWVYVHAAATAQKYADDTHSFFMLITQQLFSCPRHFRKFFFVQAPPAWAASMHDSANMFHDEG